MLSGANSGRRAVIIGAGPAGLTAAYELLTRAGIQPIVLEKSEYMGGISRTVNYKGNRIDIGGHRFFSKSDRVMEWWLRMLPLQARGTGSSAIRYHGMERTVAPAAGGPTRHRGPRHAAAAAQVPHLLPAPLLRLPDLAQHEHAAQAGPLADLQDRGQLYEERPVSPQAGGTLEQFFINRFGAELYRTFFKSYTEKVWGVPCSHISAEWGAQRIKGLSVWVDAAARARERPAGGQGDIGQKDTETSLIEQFLYPKFGPGQMWEEVARRIVGNGRRDPHRLEGGADP